jgi:DNA-binding transcriptional LysR family regulator
MDRLAAIKVFVAIAEAGSLSAAGRRLGVPLTTVSRHLAALEAQIGVRLITRTTRDLTLTEPAGTTSRHAAASSPSSMPPISVSPGSMPSRKASLP